VAYPSATAQTCSRRDRRCKANQTPIAVIVVNSEWANGDMISRSAAVIRDSATDWPLAM